RIVKPILDRNRLAFGFAQALLRLSQQAGQFFDLGRSLARSRPSQFRLIVREQPFLRGEPVIQSGKLLSLEMMEAEIGDAERDDPHETNRLRRSPDHPSLRYDTID